MGESETLLLVAERLIQVCLEVRKKTTEKTQQKRRKLITTENLQGRAGTNENSDVRETPLPKGVERKHRFEHVSADQKNDVCLLPKPAQTDIDTSEVLSTLNFEAPWIPIREFWSGRTTESIGFGLLIS